MTEERKDRLYQEFRIPNPKSLKWADTRGGYTTIIAQYQMEKCTQIWGVYGTGWGLSDLNWSWIYQNGDPVYVQLDCDFFWTATEFSDAGSFEMSTGWAFSQGDSDVLKKAQTDAISKALSKLGIDSDVFKGLWAAPGTDPLKVVTYVGKDPAHDVPEAPMDRKVYLIEILFPKVTKNVSKGFEIKLNDLNWNYIAVEATIKRLEDHLKKEESKKNVSKIAK